MERKLKLIPIWLWVSVIIIIVLLCSSCRGGRSLGKGSAGTVIIPQTPQEINEKNAAPRPPLEPLPPTPISITPAPPKNPTVITPTPVAPPVAPPAAPLESVRSTPTLPESKSAEANPVIINPKPAGEEPKSFTPTISKNTTPVKLTAAKSKEKVNVIKLPEKNQRNNDGVITLDPREENGFPEEKPFINWGELISYWLFVILMIVFGWIVYDTVMGFIKEKKLQKEENSRAKKTQEKLIKKPAKGSRKSRKKAISKKGKKVPNNT